MDPIIAVYIFLLVILFLVTPYALYKVKTIIIRDEQTRLTNSKYKLYTIPEENEKDEENLII